jgi:hypothetical protein
MRKYLIIVFLAAFLADLSGQDNTSLLTGQVSFISAKNVYVKFKSTDGIAAGDTLFSKSDNMLIPVLTVTNLSSMSCLCTPVNNSVLSVADNVIARIRLKVRTEATENTEPVAAILQQDTTIAVGKSKTDALKQNITGSISAYSYSNISNTSAGNSQRFRYNLSLNARNIGNSGLSFETYASFTHKLGEWESVKSNIFRALKIFNLSLIYDPGKSLNISIGRRINPRLANIGASDGIQIEKTFGLFSVGALAGTRPDYEDYGFNKDLLQFGGYLGLKTRKKSVYSESSVAFMQQMNGSNIDRRFLYFQHSNSLIKNLFFTGTFEVDLYSLSIDTVNNSENGSTGFDPTGMYLSLRYRFSDRFYVSGSFDARKNVIYYETYKNFIDRLLEDQMRQGYRLQARYRITRDITVGLQGGYRFLKSDPHPSKNIYGYFTHSNIPGANVSVTISGTYTESSYVTGKIYGATVMRDMLMGKLQASLGYRYVDYTMPENDITEIQHIGEANLYWLFAGKMSFGLNYEGTFEKQNIFHMIYLQLRKRF